jgi:hypothetical protein
MPRIYENAKTNFSSFEEFKEIGVKTIQEIYGRVRPLDVFDFSQNETHYKVVGYYDGEVIPEEQAAGEPQSAEAAEAERIAREQDEANRAAAEEENQKETTRLHELVDAGVVPSPEDTEIAVRLGIAKDLDEKVSARFDALKAKFGTENVVPSSVEVGKPVILVVTKDNEKIAEGTFAELEALQVVVEELTEEQAADLEAKVKSGHISFEAAEAAGLKTVDGVAIADARKAARGGLQSDIAAANGEAAGSTITKDLPYGVKEHDGKLISDAALELAIANKVDLKKIDGTGRDGVIKKSDVADYIKNHAPAQENANGNDSKQSNA